MPAPRTGDHSAPRRRGRERPGRSEEAATAAAPELPRGAEVGDVYALFADGDGAGTSARCRARLSRVDNRERRGARLRRRHGRAGRAGSTAPAPSASQAPSIKPFVWLAALDNGVFPEQWVLNGPISIRRRDEIWTPGNYDGRRRQLHHGLQRARAAATTRSRRGSAVHVGMPEVRRVLVSASLYPPSATGLLLSLRVDRRARDESPHRMAMGMRALDWRNSGTCPARRNLQDLERMMRGVVVPRHRGRRLRERSRGRRRKNRDLAGAPRRLVHRSNRGHRVRRLDRPRRRQTPLPGSSTAAGRRAARLAAPVAAPVHPRGARPAPG